MALVLPIRRDPVLSEVTLKPVTEPSTSASSALAANSAKVISTGLSSAVLSTEPDITVIVGTSFTAVIVSVAVAVAVCGPLLAALLLLSVTL